MLEFITKMKSEIPCDYVWNGNDELECGHIVYEDTPSKHKKCEGNLLNRPGFCPMVEIKEISIPDIATNSVLVAVIDELKHRIKAAGFCAHTSMIGQFNECLNVFIKEHNLGNDQHNFASLPEDKTVATSEFKARLSELYKEASDVILNTQMQHIYDEITASAKTGKDCAVFSVVKIDLDVAKLVAKREGLKYKIDGPRIEIWGWV